MAHLPNIEVEALVEQSTGKEYERAEFKDVRNNFWMIFYNAWRARKYLKTCEVIHAFDLYPYGLIAAIANIGLKKRLFINGVGTESVVKLDHRFLGPILKWVYRSAEKVLCISEYTKKRILEKIPDLKNLEVVYLGVDYEKFSGFQKNVPPLTKGRLGGVFTAMPSESRPPLTPPSKGGEPVLIGVGQPKRRKGYNIVIKALGKLKDKYPKLKYYIVGRQSIRKYIAELKSLVKSEGLESNVEFLENISDNELIGLYSSADLFVLTSINIGQHFEGFGLVLLEAGASGLPSVGTRDCGIEEAVVDGETGLLVPQKDVGATSGAIDDLLSDDAKRKKMGLAAKIFAQKMDWSQTVENYLKYYERSV